MFESPAVAERVTTRLARRLRSTASQRRLLGLPSPFQRLCAQLLMLIEHSDADQPVVLVPPTHQEIAIMIDASRETVTRAFQALQAQRILRRDGDLLRIENLGQLRAIAEGKREAPRP
jgi:CRP-like cAMP-binding protein